MRPYTPKKKPTKKPKKHKSPTPATFVSYAVFTYIPLNTLVVAINKKLEETLRKDKNYRPQFNITNHQLKLRLYNLLHKAHQPFPMKFDDTCQFFLDEPIWLSRGMLRYFKFVKYRHENGNPLPDGVIPLMECQTQSQDKATWVCAITNVAQKMQEYEDTKSGDYFAYRHVWSGVLYASSAKHPRFNHRNQYEFLGTLRNMHRSMPVVADPTKEKVDARVEDMHGETEALTATIRDVYSKLLWKNFRQRISIFPLFELSMSTGTSAGYEGGDYEKIVQLIEPASQSIAA